MEPGEHAGAWRRDDERRIVQRIESGAHPHRGRGRDREELLIRHTELLDRLEALERKDRRLLLGFVPATLALAIAYTVPTSGFDLGAILFAFVITAPLHALFLRAADVWNGKERAQLSRKLAALDLAAEETDRRTER